MSRETTVTLGLWGEDRVAEQLQACGHVILARRWHCRFGELDLVTRHDAYLCFVEVKLRKNAHFAPARAFVTLSKQKKLRLAAELYLSEHPEQTAQPRFDVAEIYAPQGCQTSKPTIQYWENAF